MSELGKRLAKRIGVSADPKPLYVRRNVTNASEIIDWAKAQGFPKTLPAEELHVTIVFSREPMDWTAAGDNFDQLRFEGGPRTVAPLGDKGAVVLKFEAAELQTRWQEFRDAGASWDFPGYQPHVSITYDGGDIDLAGVEPYAGPIELGPEIFEPLDDDWAESVVEKFQKSNEFLKVDRKLGLVFGWGCVCKVDGEDFFDSQGDHIPEDSMIEATTDFMENSRVAKEMHVGESRGAIVHSFPLTADIAKAMGITSKHSGWMIAMKPHDPSVLTKFEDGTYTGFSIGGAYLEDEAA